MSDWLSDTVDGWSPDTVLLLQPYGMVEEVLLTYLHCGFDPLLHLSQSPYAWVWYGSLGFSWNPFSHTNDYDERNEIYNRIFKFCCTDLSVSVRLYYIDGNDIIECGRLESAARFGSDSNPVPQTNLGLTNLYSSYCRIVPMGCWELPLVRFLHIYFGSIFEKGLGVCAYR